MSRSFPVSLTALLVVAIGLPAQPVTGADLAPAGAAPEAVDSSGIPLVKDIVQARPKSEEQAQALSDALEFAEAHPDDVGYPWVDPASGQLVLSAASPAGSEQLEAKRSTMAVASTTRDVKFSFGRLEEIKHEVTTLHAAGVPDAYLIYATSPDDKSNRVVITVSAPSTRLFQELASRYGTEAIAIQIDPDGPGGSSASRNNDSNRYWGGAAIFGVQRGVNCSDSFSWTISGASGTALLTAAHCAPSGGVINIGSGGAAGAVAAFSEENWSLTTGTTYYSGQSTFRGDVAIICLYSTLGSDPKMYRGGPTSISASNVVQTLRRYAAVGDLVYVGGGRTGETGNYTTVNRRTDWWYANDGPNVWVRNVSRATRDNTCADQGDSGGSVFGIVSGGVQAVGTYSGFGPSRCSIYYTNIYDSYLSLPGDVTLY